MPITAALFMKGSKHDMWKLHFATKPECQSSTQSNMMRVKGLIKTTVSATSVVPNKNRYIFLHYMRLKNICDK